MGDLQLDPGTDEAIARRYAVAARRIGELEPPPVFDAGPATGDLVAILGQLVRTAGQLAAATAMTATAVRAVGAELGSTDEQVRASFARMRGGS